MVRGMFLRNQEIILACNHKLIFCFISLNHVIYIAHGMPMLSHLYIRRYVHTQHHAQDYPGILNDVEKTTLMCAQCVSSSTVYYTRLTNEPVRTTQHGNCMGNLNVDRLITR